MIYLAATLVLFGFTMMGMMTMTLFVKGFVLGHYLDARRERCGRRDL